LARHVDLGPSRLETGTCWNTCSSKKKKKKLMYSSYLSMLIVKTKYRETLQQSIMFCKESYKAFFRCFNFSFNIYFFFIETKYKQMDTNMDYFRSYVDFYTHTHTRYLTYTPPQIVNFSFKKYLEYACYFLKKIKL
jgi:hypothetical protein